MVVIESRMIESIIKCLDQFLRLVCFGLNVEYTNEENDLVDTKLSISTSTVLTQKLWSRFKWNKDVHFEEFVLKINKDADLWRLKKSDCF